MAKSWNETIVRFDCKGVCFVSSLLIFFFLVGLEEYQNNVFGSDGRRLNLQLFCSFFNIFSSFFSSFNSYRICVLKAEDWLKWMSVSAHFNKTRYVCMMSWKKVSESVCVYVHLLFRSSRLYMHHRCSRTPETSSGNKL